MKNPVLAVFVSLVVGTGAASAQSPAAPPSSSATWPAAGRLSLSAEASLWWLQQSPTPVALVTDGLAGLASTTVLIGGGALDTNPSGGVRVGAAYTIAGGTRLEGNVFYVSSRSTSRSVSSTGQPGSTDLLVSFFDVTLNTENYTDISFSPVYSGSGREELKTSLWGAELNGAWSLSPQGAWRPDILAGLRYLRLAETYTFTTSSPYIPPYPADIWNTTDSFDATNQFYGVQVGLRARYDDGPWTAVAAAKIALGSMSQGVNVSGFLETNDFTNYGPTQNFSGGYFALPTNSGNHSRNVFAAMPELALNVGYRVTPNLTILAGYAILYASSVVRPGDQIDRNINPTQSVSYVGTTPVALQGPAQPSFSFNDSTFWAQNVNLSIAYSF